MRNDVHVCIKPSPSTNGVLAIQRISRSLHPSAKPSVGGAPGLASVSSQRHMPGDFGQHAPSHSSLLSQIIKADLRHSRTNGQSYFPVTLNDQSAQATREHTLCRNPINLAVGCSEKVFASFGPFSVSVPAAASHRKQKLHLGRFASFSGGQESLCHAGWCPVAAMVWKEPNFPREDHPDWNAEEPYKDPVALLEHRELQVRQKFVRMEKAKARRCPSACLAWVLYPARSAPEEGA